MTNLALLLLPATLVGCAIPLETGADQVQIVTASQKESRCKSLGIVSTQQRLGPNKPGNAMTQAINEAARRGGNGLYVVSAGQDWIEGASVTAEALRCQI